MFGWWRRRQAPRPIPEPLWQAMLEAPRIELVAPLMSNRLLVPSQRSLRWLVGAVTSAANSRSGKDEPVRATPLLRML